MDAIKVSIITSLYRGEKYLESFLYHLSKLSNPWECEWILVHNDPTETELILLENFKESVSMIETVHLKVGREPLYSSWNRAVAAARGEYITIWNIDDIRRPDSIQQQLAVLEKETDAAIVYGNYKIVNYYGNTTGVDVVVPDFHDKPDDFLRQHYIGPFPLWRKDLHKVIGYFDEQFKLVSDLDFQIRASRVSPLVKVNKELGTYLEGTADNLSSNYQLQDLENTVLQLRYGNFDLIYLTHFFSAILNYKIRSYKWFGNYTSMADIYNYQTQNYWANFPLIFFSLLKLPRHLARKYLKPIVRAYLKNQNSKGALVE
ncbi:glycosyltransferase family 2 protein [Pontibacter burrus]|uniref:Glycosyltransferase family 2 protein n=1 Tax=Pontibacter burrus TaxID=2704466 RepID=A0A6B3LWC6_9BACT|nr:glycosyltransferase family 2 protein [Pontibacter burrus]NEM97744.1 glycosyltransferase family 2 protein [Pontibacter burrus]